MYQAGHEDLKRLKGILKRLPRKCFRSIPQKRIVVAGINVKKEDYKQPGIELAKNMFFCGDDGYRGTMLVGRQDGTVLQVVIRGCYVNGTIIDEWSIEGERDPQGWDYEAIYKSFSQCRSVA